MKPDIHPNYGEATVKCSCGKHFTTESTKSAITVELATSATRSSPASRSWLTPVAGVERFQRRYARRPRRALPRRRARAPSTCRAFRRRER